MQRILIALLALLLLASPAASTAEEYGGVLRGAYFGNLSSRFEVAHSPFTDDYFVVFTTSHLWGIKRYHVYQFNSQLEEGHRLFSSWNPISSLMSASQGLYYYVADEWRYGGDIDYWDFTTKTATRYATHVNTTVGYHGNKLLYYFKGILTEFDTKTRTERHLSGTCSDFVACGKDVYFIEEENPSVVKKYDIATTQTSACDGIIPKAMLRETENPSRYYVFYGENSLDWKQGVLYSSNNLALDASFVIGSNSVAISEDYICALFAEDGQDEITLRYAAVQDPTQVYTVELPKPCEKRFSLIDDKVFFHMVQGKEITYVDLTTGVCHMLSISR